MKWFLLILLVAPAVILTFNGDKSCFAVSEEDDVDDEMVDVEGEETAVTGEDAVEEEEAADKPTGSPDADTTILFTKPVRTPGNPFDLPAGLIVEFLVGFKNNGPQDFVLETLDASFRYPMDFNFYIQNFSTLNYERPVKTQQEATLSYSFIPTEAFSGRPFGLSVNLRYRDLSGNQFYESVFNETVNIIELDEGLDGETFFLYLFLGVCGVLCLVVGQQFLVSVGKKRVMSMGGQSKKPVETGTNNRDDIDYEWIPKETLQSLKNGQIAANKNLRQKRPKKFNKKGGDVKDKDGENKSPRVTKSPKTSPRTRKVDK